MESILRESDVGQGHEVPVVRGETFYETLKPRSRVTEDVTFILYSYAIQNILFRIKYCIFAITFQGSESTSSLKRIVRQCSLCLS